ncbi:MAG: hypothetical protein ACOYON_02190 [Fimbriimonas sp.]
MEATTSPELSSNSLAGRQAASDEVAVAPTGERGSVPTTDRIREIVREIPQEARAVVTTVLSGSTPPVSPQSLPATRAASQEPGAVAPVARPKLEINIGNIEVQVQAPAPIPTRPTSRPARETRALDDFLRAGKGRP